MKFWFFVCLAIAVGAATAAVLLVQMDAWETAPDWLLWVAPAVLGLVAFTETAVAATIERRGNRAAGLEASVRHALLAALDSVQLDTKIEHRQLGLNCYAVPRWYLVLLPRKLRRALTAVAPTGLRRRLWKGPPLGRIGDAVSLAARKESAIDWHYGKGVLGRCWKTRKDVGMDLYARYGRYVELDEQGNATVACSKEEWERQVPNDVKLELSYEEFSRIGGKYGAVVATPILNRSEFLGCVVLDAAWGDHFSSIWTPKVRELLGNAADYIKPHLS